MKLYWTKTNWIIKKIFSNYIWDVSTTGNTVYLTFDDGPIADVTEWVLEQLKTHEIKATFFCIGDNVEKNPKIFKKIIAEGHTVGNHTFNHLNGWKTSTEQYINNTKQAQEAIKTHSNQNPILFRPPYGTIKKSQSKELKKLGFKIIMWDVLSADFDATISQEQCLSNVLSNVKAGSIIVFHDSIKAHKNLHYVLPRTLAYLKENNFKCDTLSLL